MGRLRKECKESSMEFASITSLIITSSVISSTDGVRRRWSFDPVRRKTILLVLLFLSFGSIFAGSRIGLNVYDEGIVTYGAMRILDGELPYRDFWAITPPDNFI